MKGINRGMRHIFSITDGHYDRQLVQDYESALQKANFNATLCASKTGIDIRDLFTTTYTFFYGMPTIEAVKNHIETLKIIDENWIRMYGKEAYETGHLFDNTFEQEQPKEKQAEQKPSREKKWMHGRKTPLRALILKYPNYEKTLIQEYMVEARAVSCIIRQFKCKYGHELLETIYTADAYFNLHPSIDEVKADINMLQKVNFSWLYNNLSRIQKQGLLDYQCVINPTTREGMVYKEKTQPQQSQQVVQETIEVKQETNSAVSIALMKELDEMIQEIYIEALNSNDLAEIKLLLKQLGKLMDKRNDKINEILQ